MGMPYDACTFKPWFARLAREVSPCFRAQHQMYVGAIPSLAMKARATLGVGVREAMAMRTPHSLRRILPALSTAL